jgi:hypothetical protein
MDEGGGASFAFVGRYIVRAYLIGTAAVRLQKSEAKDDRQSDQNQNQSPNEGGSVDLVPRSTARLDGVEMRLGTILFFIHTILRRGEALRLAGKFPLRLARADDVEAVQLLYSKGSMRWRERTSVRAEWLEER